MATSVEVGQQIVENERANEIYNTYISIKERMGENVEELRQEQTDMLLGEVSFARKAIEVYAVEIKEYYNSLRN